MTSEQHLSLGQRIYRALFKVFGPADVGQAGPPAAHNPDDKTVPAGYHLETITDGSGIRRRIAVQDEPETTPPTAQPHNPAPGEPGQGDA
jgi:hypothetical protein